MQVTRRDFMKISGIAVGGLAIGGLGFNLAPV
ncbi:MAG: twin-arginine translocation signal domain-containing protein, partial [Nitrospirota bacterium]